jgi:hypothetical protein
MKRLKTYESFGRSGFRPEMISEQDYNRVKKSGIHLRFSTGDVARLYTKAKEFNPRILSWMYGDNRGHVIAHFPQVVKNVDLIFSTRLEIMSIEESDEPYVYFIINWGYRNSVASWRNYRNFPPDSKLYGRMEYEEFEMIRENAKIWKDFCVQKILEEDKKTHQIVQESFGGSIPDPEPMSNREWTNEVTDAEEVPFSQKDKELFIALSDTISLENKYNQPTIARTSLSFNLINGLIDPKLRTSTIISSVTTYKNDDEFYYVAVWEKTYLDEKLYRCDGYECWEKFLKEIFEGYRKLTKQTKTNESFFNEVPEPELIDVDEWDKVVIDKEVDFTQKEKEFFIDLADTIPSNNNIDSLYIEDYQLTFSMSNGKDPIYPNIKFDDRVRSITSYKDDDEFYYVSVWEYDGTESTNELYRCDGYKCWEKFIREIFDSYRELSQTSQV